VAGHKRDRQRSNRQRAAALAAREAKRRAVRRRIILLSGAAVVVLAVVLVVLLSSGGDDGKDTVNADNSSSTTPTTAAALASAAGKPCVAVSEPLPPGAPEVPVEVGPAPTQLVKKDLKEGTGATVGPNDTVSAKYIGVSCSSGKIFDASYKRGDAPATFPLSNVIKGWTDGIPGMKVGGQRLLGIPAEQAYGKTPRPGSGIAPDEPLWFVVEITDTKAA
jgi:peptidylprolyl isomerase